MDKTLKSRLWWTKNILCSYIYYFLFQGFGGKFGVQTDRKDKSALSYDDQTEKIGTNYER